ncbi:uncharacterized protein F5147DRAFT_769896 [Suillus discolor]|uniref:Uncharacterized protein n=1 Tax=Suillus discolor TaxID=1912936 RepID=A0A9P7FEZ3_9AGAM|nr:uncharacterized protein F5147DRAFT_769896 [Suillus discolor]KAG2114587.1 hypothetical protein F5147DRAFT_769896 [Suillus discolor]
MSITLNHVSKVPVTFLTAPHTEVMEKGDIIYSKVIQESVHKLEACVEEMVSGDIISTANIQKVQDVILKLWTVVRSQPGISQDQKNHIKALTFITLPPDRAPNQHAQAFTVVTLPPNSCPQTRTLFSISNASLALDCIPLFTAVPENDHEIDGLDDKSELAHRIMLVSILGAAKNKKTRHFITRPIQAILSLSANHGLWQVGASICAWLVLLSDGPNALDFKVINGAEGEQDLEKLSGIIDLEKVVVFTGFTEVGPWDSSCTH